MFLSTLQLTSLLLKTSAYAYMVTPYQVVGTYDVDGSGSIDFDEFLLMISGLLQNARRDATKNVCVCVYLCVRVSVCMTFS